MKPNGSTPRDAKNANLKIILSEIRKCETIQRIDLSKRILLSKPSISKNIEILMHMGLVDEVGVIDTAIGRKPSLLRYSSTWGCIAVVDLSSTDLRIILSDMNGKILDFDTIPDVILLGEQHFQQIIDSINRLFDLHKSKHSVLRLVCIGTPGEINFETNYFIYAPRIENATKINLKKIFEKSLAVETVVYNDINLAAIGEHLYGQAVNLKNVMYIWADYGIGSGLILDGHLYQGAHGAAGEIGLLLVNMPDDIEEVSRKNEDFFDYHVTAFAIKNYVKDCLYKGEETSVRNFCENFENIPFESIVAGYQNQDAVCCRAVEHAARILAGMITNFAQLLDIELFIIGGKTTQLGQNYIDRVNSIINCNSRGFSHGVVFSKMGNEAILYGGIGEAIRIAIERIVKISPTFKRSVK